MYLHAISSQIRRRSRGEIESRGSAQDVCYLLDVFSLTHLLNLPDKKILFRTKRSLSFSFFDNAKE